MFSAVGLFAVLLLQGCSVALSDSEKHQVVIVGAGVSGISAAATLLEHNISDVIILEASDRIGGRIHTVEYGGVTIDKGAEFVHGQQDNVVYEMIECHDLIVSFVDTYFQPEQQMFFDSNGEEMNSTHIVKLLMEASDILGVEGPFNTSVADYFNTKFGEFVEKNKLDSNLAEAIRHVTLLNQYSLFGPDDLNILGGSEFTVYKDCPGDSSLKWKQGSGGYKKIFEFITKKFPNPEEELPVFNKTILNKEVVEIKHEEGKEVEVKCADGSTYLADHVIVTVSLGFLKKHADTMFQPALPEKKMAAIKELDIGKVGKIWILFEKRWWPDNITVLQPMFSDEELQEFKNSTKHGYWTAETLGLNPILGSDRMVMMWIVGKACMTMESLSEEDFNEGVEEFLQKTLGKKFQIPKPESTMRTNWGSNPFTLGSYSFPTVESDKQNLSNSDLAAPILDINKKPVILFAGEATNSYHYATVHGALETGRREANNIIDYVNKQQTKL